jgi:hypothetical protein
MRRTASFGVALRSGLTLAAPCAGFVALACAITWPLPRFLSTRVLGPVSGDLGVYIWNLWIFRHELMEHGRLPVSTDHLFAYTGPADFSLHNYTPVADALAVPLVGAVGLVAAFNLLLLAKIALSALATFALCRHLGLSRWSAWIAGACFVASPAMVARQTAHISLVSAAALPLFLLALLHALTSRRWRDGVLVGLTVAFAVYSDAYYGVYCVLMGMAVLVSRFVRLECRPSVSRPVRGRYAIDVLIGALGALVAWRAFAGADVLMIGPVRVSMTTLYNPVLALTLLVLLRAWVMWRPRLRLHDADIARRLVPAGLVSCGVALVLLLPTLAALVLRARAGRLPETATLWRSSPRGVDLLAYLVPNPNHPVLPEWTQAFWLPDKSDAFPEYVAAFPLAALGIIAVAGVRRALPRFWVGFTLLFVLLSLGPFIHVAGHQTYVTGPWALLRYLPVVEMARSPARFALVAMLGAAVLLAFALDSYFRTRPVRWLMVVPVVVVAAFELVPGPRTTYSAEIPALYSLVAREGGPDSRVLELPTGLRDGTSSMGDFDATSMYHQTRHGRPLIGGYLSRISEWRKRANMHAPMMRALIALSDPAMRVPAQWLEEGRAAGRRFLSESCVGFVVIDRHRATPALRAYAVETMNLSAVVDDGRYQLFVPVGPPPCQPGR